MVFIRTNVVSAPTILKHREKVRPLVVIIQGDVDLAFAIESNCLKITSNLNIKSSLNHLWVYGK